jgi:hypothetical protein
MVKKPLSEDRCGWANNVKMDLGKVEFEHVTVFMWLRVDCCEHGNEHRKSMFLLTEENTLLHNPEQ